MRLSTVHENWARLFMGVMALSAFGACGQEGAEDERAAETSGAALAGEPDPVGIRQGAAGCIRTTDPGPYEVLVYTEWEYYGACAILKPGFYPGASNIGLPGRSISAIKVGTHVRARMFYGAAFTGGWEIVREDEWREGLAHWNDRIHSMRIELASRLDNCHDLQPGEVGMWRDYMFQGDCVALPADRMYPNSVDLGIANDEVSSLMNASDRIVNLYNNAWFDRHIFYMRPGDLLSFASGNDANDKVTSMRP